MSQNKQFCTHLNSHDEEKVLQLLTNVFEVEQGIPRSYLPVPFSMQYGYGLWENKRLIGVAIVWYDGQIWHWGRFAIDSQFRGLGLGKKLAYFSISSIFNLGIDELMIEARDLTVSLLSGFGAEIIGDPYDIFGKVTPMKLKKSSFEKSSSRQIS